MLGSSALELGIGLSLFFLFVSLICSAAREAIETIMKSRASDLERGLRAMLDDPNGTQLTRELMSHGQIFSLFDGDYDPANLKTSLLGTLQLRWGARKAFPSYIPAENFASAFLDVVARGSALWPYPVDSRALSVDGLRRGAAMLPSVRLQRVVLSAIDHGGEDLQSIRKELERWFDGSMDRVSGWYKRRTQIFLFVIGLAAAVVLNLDALTVAKRLTTDEALRSRAVAAAETVQAKGANVVEAESFDDAKSNLQAIGYPIGWLWRDGRLIAAPQACKPESKDCTAYELNVGDFLIMVLGWIVTGAATTFGASFWFDVLNKFMVVRSTVKPRQKSREEGSSDAQSTKTDVAAPLAPAPPAPPAPALDDGPGPVPVWPAASDDEPTWRSDFVNEGEVVL